MLTRDGAILDSISVNRIEFDSIYTHPIVPESLEQKSTLLSNGDLKLVDCVDVPNSRKSNDVLYYSFVPGASLVHVDVTSGSANVIPSPTESENEYAIATAYDINNAIKIVISNQVYSITGVSGSTVVVTPVPTETLSQALCQLVQTEEFKLGFPTSLNLNNYTLHMPSTQGAASTTLLNDGNGQLSWGSSSSGTTLQLDTVTEATAGLGVTVESVLLKNGLVTCDSLVTTKLDITGSTPTSGQVAKVASAVGDVATLAWVNGSVTVVAGDGLSGGGAVVLGGSVNLGVGVDDSTIEIDSDALRLKDAGVTLAKLQSISRGSVLIGNSSARPAELTVGAAKSVLISDGTDLSFGDVEQLVNANTHIKLATSSDNIVYTVPSAKKHSLVVDATERLAVSASGASIAGVLQVDTINEMTSLSGVTIDSVLSKDGVVHCKTVELKNGSSPASIDLYNTGGSGTIPSTDSLIAHYAFDNNLIDSTGNQSTMTGISGTSLPTFVTERAFGTHSADFTGQPASGSTRDVAIVDIAGDLTVGTISLFFRVDAQNNITTGLAGFGQTSSSAAGVARYFELSGQTSGSVVLSFLTGMSETKLVLNSSIVFGVWHHCAATWSGSSGGYVKLYFDGTLVSTTSVPTLTTVNNRFAVGARNQGGWMYYDGQVDDLKIWNRVLNDNDILGMFELLAGVYYTRLKTQSSLASSIDVMLPLTTGTLFCATVTSVASGQSLRYNGSDWVNSVLNLSDLGDVTIDGTLATDHTLKYNGTNWVTSPMPYSSFASINKISSSGTTNITSSTLNNSANNIRFQGTSTSSGSLVTASEENFMGNIYTIFTVSMAGNYLVVCNLDVGIDFVQISNQDNERVTLGVFKNNATLMMKTITDVSARTTSPEDDLDADNLNLNLILPLQANDKLHFNVRSEDDANSYIFNAQSNVYVAFISA